MRAGLLAAGVFGLLVLLAVGASYALGVPTVGTTRSTPALSAAAPQSLAVGPGDGSLIKATARGLFRSTDGGRRWTPLPLPAPLAQFSIGQVVINPDKPALVYVAGIGVGVMVSEDHGTTWRRMTTGLPTMDVEALATHAFRRETLYVSIKGKGIYRTEDGGQQWKRMDGGPAGKPLLALAHSPLPGSMNTGWLYAGTVDGPYLSMDCF